MLFSSFRSFFKSVTPRHGFVDQDDLNTHQNTGTTRQALGAAEVSRHTSRYPSPLDLNYFWGFGSMALVCLVLQLVSGIILAMHYVAHVDLAFASVEHIMRNVNGGWFFRYMHANGASFFFIVVYAHIARGLFYRSYITNYITWATGVIIFLLLVITAFLGYVLPWGQMSFWGATVITNLCSAIPVVGDSLVQWLWGGFSVGNSTLKRFFSLHYLLPIIVTALVGVHIYFLHLKGSGNASGSDNHRQHVAFYPYFFVKDAVGVFGFLLVYFTFVFFFPNTLGHPDNYIEANPYVTPTHIVPEWYLLPFYAILRSIPNKLGGVIVMLLSILILLLSPIFDFGRSGISPRYSFLGLFFYWFFIFTTILLGWLGGMPAEEPYTTVAQLSAISYFFYFGGALPILAWIDKKKKRI